MLALASWDASTATDHSILQECIHVQDTFCKTQECRPRLQFLLGEIVYSILYTFLIISQWLQYNRIGISFSPVVLNPAFLNTEYQYRFLESFLYGCSYYPAIFEVVFWPRIKIMAVTWCENNKIVLFVGVWIGADSPNESERLEPESESENRDGVFSTGKKNIGKTSFRFA